MAYYFYLGNVLLPIPPKKLELKISNQNKTYDLMNYSEINVPDPGRFRAHRGRLSGGYTPRLRHQCPERGEKQQDRAGSDPGPHRPEGEDYQQLRAALSHLQSHRGKGRRL